MRCIYVKNIECVTHCQCFRFNFHKQHPVYSSAKYHIHIFNMCEYKHKMKLYSWFNNFIELSVAKRLPILVHILSATVFLQDGVVYEFPKKKKRKIFASHFICTFYDGA